MEVEQIPIDRLIPYARNSRLHGAEQVAQIAASIKEFGFNNPILIDKDDGIIAGHGRVLAARKLELKVVPCIRLLNLTENEKRAYIIADNKIALNSTWDEELLKIEVLDLQEKGFEVGFLGFNQDELSKLLEDINLNEDEEKKGVEIHSVFEVVAECQNEDEQRMVYNILNEKGIKCRLSTL